MSCTLMYQPYAMSYSSSCDRPSASAERQKLFKFPHVPSPPDSSHSGASSYSGHSSSASSATNLHIPNLLPSAAAGSSFSLSLSAAAAGHLHSPSNRNSRRPLTPCASSTSTGPSATITSASQAQHQQNHHHQSHHSNHQRSTSSSSSTTVTGGHNNSGSDLHHPSSSAAAAAGSASSSSTSHIHHESSHSNQAGPSGSSGSGSTSGGGGGLRAQYLSANCIVYENYDGDSGRIVDEHFSRALSAAYASDKPAKQLPMSTRNFPPSFWNSAYQPPPKPLTSYGATGDFYGSAMDYGGAISGLTAHHHQTDPWHYPLTSHHHHHQPYHHHHHRAADLAYPPMPSTSRFNPAQYGSFLFPGAAASTAAGRFGGIPSSAQCGVKGETGHWGAAGRYHPHESTWSDFHLADYSAAAAHYSNMTAGLDFESHYLQSS